MRTGGKKTVTTTLMFLLCTATVSSFLGAQIRKASAEGSGATLTGNIFDQGVDRDRDGVFDFLEVGVEVSVTEAGDYIVEIPPYGLLDKDSGRTMNVGPSQTFSLGVGIQVVNLYIRGVQIHAFGLNPTNVSISLYDSNYTLLGGLYDTPLSRKYFYAEFEAPGAALTGVIYDQGVDINENGAFDYLEIGIEVNVTEAGNYIVGAFGLRDSDSNYISVDASPSVSLDVGVQVVNIRFDGTTIFMSSLNPINVSFITLYDDSYNSFGELLDIPLSREYLYTEFDAPGAVLTGVIFDQGIDTDGNGFFDFLEVGVEVNVSGVGDYIIEVDGLLTGDYEYIWVSNSQQISLDMGVQVVNTLLDGPTICASGLNPTNISRIILRNSMYTILGELEMIPLSREYMYTEFEGPAVILTGVISDRGVDEDEDGTFDYLEIGVEVNVTEAGNYIVEANGLLDGDNSYISVGVSQSVYLDVGVQVVNIRFDGTTIYASSLNPTKASTIVLYDEFRNFIGSLYDTPLSRTYSYTEFDAPIPVTVGVKVGDWAKYNITLLWQSTDPAATEPPQFQEMRKIEYAKLEVQSINNTTITLLMTYHFINGTDQTLPRMSADIATQFVTLVIAGNLSEGDIIPGTAAPINLTVIRSYAGANRNVNCFGFSSSFFGMNMTQNMYWDKATGILCEMLMETSTLTDSYVTTTSMLLKMTETNMWKMMTELSCSVSKGTITEGDSIVVSGSLNVTLSGKTVTLTYKKPDGSTFNRTVTTGSDGRYSDSYALDATGSWSVTASWEGDSKHNGAASALRSFAVNPKPFIETPLGMATVGGGITVVVIAAIVLVLRKRRV